LFVVRRWFVAVALYCVPKRSRLPFRPTLPLSELFVVVGFELKIETFGVVARSYYVCPPKRGS
jgi:hypothetical protein